MDVLLGLPWSAGSRGVRIGLAAALAAVLTVLVSPASAEAGFGISGLTSRATDSDGTLNFQAGSRPYEYTVGFTMEQNAQGEPEAPLRAIVLDLPPGLGGNPLAVPRCTRQDFEGVTPRCPGSTQIGVVHALVVGLGEVNAPLYNVKPPPGVVASFGFSGSRFNGFEQGFLRTGRDYGFSVLNAPVSNGEVVSLTETIWGVPADPAHDAERVCIQADGTRVEGCSSDAPRAPFLTLPTSCAAPLETVVVAETLAGGGAVARRSAFSLDLGGDPAALTGCQLVPFDPKISVNFDGSAADSPTGISVDLRLPQPSGAGVLAEAHLKDTVVELPVGVAINPPVGAGLVGCAPQQVGLESAAARAPVEFTAGAAACPDAARIGSVEVNTPLVDHVLSGGVYLATPYANPFGSLFALYVVVDDEQSGVVLKLPAQLEADAGTGRLTLRLEETPQLPFEDLRLSFRRGPRAVLRTPPVCGTTHATARLTPWSAPEGSGDVILTRPFQTSIAPGGAGPCPIAEAQAANAPSFTAGTRIARAGHYSSFLLRMSRADGTQRLRTVEATLPPGLTGKLAGIPRCDDAGIAARACPAASEVGSVDIGAGAGPLPLHLAGRAYLAGPYEGAPYSLAVLTPAVAGPFDLGTVAVRIALYVDPRSAQIRAVADPLPTILRGIPLDIRSLVLELDRPGFTLNPTSCAPAPVAGLAISTLGRPAALADRFQVGDCPALGLRPQAAVRLLGPTHRGAHPRLRTVLTPRPGDANLRNVAVTLPGTELLDSRHIGRICTRAQFAAARCPASTVYGHAKAWTPLLDRPLEGPVYLRESRTKLPDLAASLRGQVDLALIGRIDSVRGRLRNTFQALPDAPLSKVVLTMQGGKRGLLVNTGGVCGGTPRTDAFFKAHNGRTHRIHPLVKADCGAS